MGIFWARGYDGTSMQDLVDGMKISRASLYDTFGGKHELFLAAVTHYGNVISERLVVLEAPGSPTSNIQRFFRGLLDAACDGDGWRGCFAVNATVERAPWCDESAEILGELRLNLENAFHRALPRARREGTLADDYRPRALARHLVGLAHGLAVVAKTRPQPRVLNDMLDVGLSVLR